MKSSCVKYWNISVKNSTQLNIININKQETKLTLIPVNLVKPLDRCM